MFPQVGILCASSCVDLMLGRLSRQEWSMQFSQLEKHRAPQTELSEEKQTPQLLKVNW